MIGFIGPLLLVASLGDVENYSDDSPEAINAQTVQKTVADVLTDPEFRHLTRSHFERNASGDDRLPQWLRDFLEWLFGGSERETHDPNDSLFDFSAFLFYLVIFLLAAFVVAILVSLARRVDISLPESPLAELEDDEAIIPTKPPGELPANEYERRALIAASTGDYRGALRELVLGSMSWTERSGYIRFRRGLTNRDYVRAVWGQADRRESLLEIVGTFERVFYGHRPAEPTAFEVCLGEFQKSFSLEANDATLAS